MDAQPANQTRNGSRWSRLRWLFFGLLTPISIFLCGQVAWISHTALEPADVRSQLTADYSPWTAAFFPGIDPSILFEVLRDRESGGWVDTRQMLNCFLPSRDCEGSQVEASSPSPGEGAGSGSEQGSRATVPLRIAGAEGADLLLPDGLGFPILAGNPILVDLRPFPILVTGGHDPQPDLIILLVPDEWELEGLEILLSTKAVGPWTPIFSGGDQKPADLSSEINYIGGALASLVGDQYPDTASSKIDGVMLGFTVNVEDSVSQPGLYGWLQFSSNLVGSAPILVDAILVVSEAN